MKSLQTAYGVYFNRKYKRIGPVFAGRFKSIIVQKDEYFLQVSKYIHLNPVRARLTEKPLDYPYSSYRELIKNNYSLINKKIIDQRATKMLVGDGRKITKTAIKSYQSFVEEKEDVLPYRENMDIFGDNTFCTKYKRRSS